MKILLVSINRCVDPYPVYPIGISVVARALRLAGHEARQFDVLASGPEPLQSLSDAIADFSPDMIGVSIRNIDSVDSTATRDDWLSDAADVCKFCKSRSHAPLFLGGAGFTISPEEILARCGADFGVAGPGEEAVPRLAAAVEAGTPPSSGAVLRGSGDLFLGADYDPGILRWYVEQAKCVPICAKRGCPFSCSYCTYPSLEGRRVQVRAKDSVINDLRNLKRLAPDALAVFTDSVFNDPDGLFRELCATRLPMFFSAFVTPFSLTERDADTMVSAGLAHAEVGIDAATDETLRGLNKPFDFKQAARACKMLRARGVSVSVSVMFGGPGETSETLRRGIDNLRSLGDCHADIFSGIRILPGTPLHKRALEEGRAPADLAFSSPHRYYYASGLEKKTVDSILTEAFRDDPYRVFPPGLRTNALRRIHKIGFLRIHAMLDAAGGEASL